MTTLVQQIQDVISANATVTQHSKSFELIENLAALRPDESSDEIDEETFRQLLALFNSCNDSRFRCTIGILILELLKYSDLAYRYLNGETTSTKHVFGNIIVAAENEDLKLISGAILSLACSKGASPGDFFSAELPQKVSEKFPRDCSALWVRNFQDYLVGLGEDNMIQESNSTMLFASSVFIDSVQFGEKNVSIMVELSPNLLTFTQVSTLINPRTIDIALKYISNAQFQSAGPKRDPANKDAEFRSRIVLTLVPTSTNHVVNGEEMFADMIVLTPEPSYDVKGFLAAIQQLKQKKIALESGAQLSSRTPSKRPALSADSGKPRSAIKSSTRAVAAFTTLLDEPTSAEKNSSDVAPNKQLPRSMRAQMRNEKGEYEVAATVQKQPTLRKSKKGKLKSPDKNALHVPKSVGKGEGGSAKEYLQNTVEVFEIPSSPGYEEAKSKKPISGASGSKKRSIRKSVASGSRKTSKGSKKKSHSVIGALQIRTRSSTASERNTYQRSEDAEMRPSEDNSKVVIEEDNGAMKRRNTEAVVSTKTASASESRKSGRQKETPSTALRRNNISDANNSSTGRLVLHDNPDSTSIYKQRGSDSNGKGDLLSEKSIRKPSIASFGAQGPMNQGLYSHKARESRIKDESRQPAPSRLSSDRKKHIQGSSNLVEAESAGDLGQPPSNSRTSIPTKEEKNSESRQEKASIQSNDEFVLISDDEFVEKSPTGKSTGEVVQMPKIHNQWKETGTVPPLAVMRTQIQPAESFENEEKTIKDMSRSKRNKRPLETISPNTIQKRVKRDDGDRELPRSETSIQQYEDFRTPADNEHPTTGSQLSRRVDTNGSPYPKNTWLPIDRNSAPITKLVSSREKLRDTEMRHTKHVQSDIPSVPHHGVTFQDSSVLWCENLPSHVTTHNVKDLFGFYGNIEWCWLVSKEYSELSSCCGYVKMHTAGEAASAVEFLDGRSLRGLTLVIRKVDGRLTFGPVNEDVQPDMNVKLASGHISTGAQICEVSENNKSQDSMTVISPPECIRKDRRVMREEERPISAPYVTVKAIPDDFEDAITGSQTKRGVQRVTRPSIRDNSPRKTAEETAGASRRSKPPSQFAKQLVTFASPLAVVKEDTANQTTGDYWDDSEETIAAEEDESRGDNNSGDGDVREELNARRMEDISKAGKPEAAAWIHSSFEASSPEYADEISANVEDPSEEEERQWEWAMKPHQEGYADKLIQISHRLLRHLMDQEAAIEDIASEYTACGLKLVAKLEESCAHDAEVMETKRKRQSEKLSQGLRGLVVALKSDHSRAREVGAMLKDTADKMGIAESEGQQLSRLDQMLVKYGGRGGEEHL